MDREMEVRCRDGIEGGNVVTLRMNARQSWLADAGVLCSEGRGWRGGWAAQGTKWDRMSVVR